MTVRRDGIDPSAEPSGPGCKECMAAGGWWFHLRRCAECGHIGCCDSSPGQHALKHYEETGHPVIRSFEPASGGSTTIARRGSSEGRPSPIRNPILKISPFPARPVASARLGGFVKGVGG